MLSLNNNILGYYCGLPPIRDSLLNILKKYFWANITSKVILGKCCPERKISR